MTRTAYVAPAPVTVRPRCSHPGCTVVASWRPVLTFAGPERRMLSLRLPRVVCAEHAIPVPGRLVTPGELELVQAAFVRYGFAPPTLFRLGAHFEGVA